MSIESPAGPTIYRTLMQDAMTEARAADGYGLRLNGLDDTLRAYVPPASVEYVESAVQSALSHAYRRGLQHGYVQAVAAVEGRA